MTSGIVEWRIESLGLRKTSSLGLSEWRIGWHLDGLEYSLGFFLGGCAPFHGLPPGAPCKSGSSTKCITICVFVLLIDL